MTDPTPPSSPTPESLPPSESTRDHLIQKTSVLILLQLGLKPLGVIVMMVFSGYWALSAQADDLRLVESITGIFALIVAAMDFYFIPALSGYLARGREAEAERLTRFCLVAFAGFLVLTSGLIYAFAENLVGFGVSFLARDGGESISTERAALILRYMAPTIFTLGMIGLCTSILNCYRIYYWPVLANVCVNLGALAGMVFLQGFFPADRTILSFAVGSVGGGLVAVLIFFPALARQGIFSRISLRPPTGELNEVRATFWPIFIAAGLAQVNFLFERFMAFGLSKGSVASLSYGLFIISIPLMLGQTSFMRVFFPSVSRDAAEGGSKAADTTAFSVKSLLFLFLPLTLFLMIFAREIVVFLYQHGNFTPADTDMVTPVLFLYAVGLWAHALNNLVFGSIFFSLKRGWWRAAIATVATVLQISLFFALSPIWEVRGIVMAITITKITSVVLSFLILRRLLPRFRLGLMGGVSFRIVLASAGMGAVLWLYRWGLDAAGWLAGLEWSGAIGVLAVAGVIAGASYLGLAVLLRLRTREELAQVKRVILRRG